jgi:hypothetical protein
VLRGGTEKPTLSPAVGELVKTYIPPSNFHVSPAATVITMPLTSARADAAIDCCPLATSARASSHGAFASSTLLTEAKSALNVVEITLFTDARSLLITLPAEKACENTLLIRLRALCSPFTDAVADPPAEYPFTDTARAAESSVLVTLPPPPPLALILFDRALTTACRPVAEPPPADVAETFDTAERVADAAE